MSSTFMSTTNHVYNENYTDKNQVPSKGHDFHHLIEEINTPNENDNDRDDENSKISATVNASSAVRTVAFHDEIVFSSTYENNKNNNNTTTRVILRRLIDQGQYRSIYLGSDVLCPSRLYAVKKVECLNEDGLKECQKEIDVYERVVCENIMSLLGVKFVRNHDEQVGKNNIDGDQTTTVDVKTKTECYMLFPYIPQSLGDEITSRKLLQDIPESKRRPYSKHQALTIFLGVVRAINAMHEVGLSHRDIRVENILLQKNVVSRHNKRPQGIGKRQKQQKRNNKYMIGTPLLSDMGSVAPTVVHITSSSDVWLADADIERNTTAAYRAPELFSEMLLKSTMGDEATASLPTMETPPTNNNEQERESSIKETTLHYDKADIWSLGCLLFAMLYGTSPFEMVWGVSLVEGMETEGTVRYTGAVTTLEKTMESNDPNIPFPPLGSAADERYDEDMKDLIRMMLKVDYLERPSASELVGIVQKMIDEENEK